MVLGGVLLNTPHEFIILPIEQTALFVLKFIEMIIKRSIILGLLFVTLFILLALLA